MADKNLSIVNGEVGNLVVKPTFEGADVVSNVSIDTDASDLKGLVTIGALSPDTDTGLLTVPLTAVAVGVQEAVIVFKYDNAPTEFANTENYGISTKTIALTITEAIVAQLADVSTPLTMDLWATQNLTFKVEKGGEDITSSVTSVTVDPASIADKFEFEVDGTTYTFKSIQSSESEVVTATAKVTVEGTEGGEAYTLEADVVLNTNVNDGSIPTNRFNVEME